MEDRNHVKTITQLLFSCRFSRSYRHRCLRGRAGGSRNFSSPIHLCASAPSKPRPHVLNKRVQDQAAAQRARWPSYNFPPPNGGLLVYTIMSDGNPACASYDGGGCLWGQTYDRIDFTRVRPLVCGQEHRAKWGVTGYEDAKHWCSLASAMRGYRR